MEGRGITENELDVVKIVQTTKKEKFGKETKIESDYVSDAIKIIGQIKNKQDVTVDIGGGAARNIAPLLLEKIGCTVKSINENLENSTRGPDPTTDNLSKTI